MNVLEMALKIFKQLIYIKDGTTKMKNGTNIVIVSQY